MVAAVTQVKRAVHETAAKVVIVVVVVVQDVVVVIAAKVVIVVEAEIAIVVVVAVVIAAVIQAVIGIVVDEGGDHALETLIVLVDVNKYPFSPFVMFMLRLLKLKVVLDGCCTK